MRGSVALANAQNLAQESGLLGSNERRQFFADMRRYCEATALQVRRRNEKIAEQARAEVQRGALVAIIIGTGHFGAAEILRRSGVSIAEPHSSRYRDLPPFALLTAEVAAGKPLDESRLRLASLQELVLSVFYHFQAASGAPSSGNEVMHRAISMAARWDENEAFDLARRMADDTWQEKMRSWILSHGTADDRRFFGVVA